MAHEEETVNFRQYVRVDTIIDLKKTEKEPALRELAQALCRALKVRKQKPIIDEMLRREEAASTFIGHGLAIPQTRGPIKEEFAIAIGRSIDGVNYDAARGARAHMIVLVMTRDSEGRTPIELLSEIANFFKSKVVRDLMLSSDQLVDVNALISAKGLIDRSSPRGEEEVRGRANPVVSAAVDLTRALRASALVIFADTVQDNKFLTAIKSRGKLIIVTSDKSRFDQDDKRISAIIQAPPFPASRTGQIRIGILLALSRNLLRKDDKVVCISGNSTNGAFDTVVALDVASEYDLFFSTRQKILPEDVKPEVLERILGLAGEIAVEGREGKPIGTIFVLGDTNTVNAHIRQLIINPFRGYSELERNILDPGLAETIKEFASIDGAFVITGDGVVLSAGSYLSPQGPIESLPSGFGARHAAAAGITAVTKSLAIAISESTGMVSLFKGGKVMMTIAKPIVHEKENITEEIV
jgi:DNA integrity scanning protein DisA with diadenylate cyclase activity/mannitol/fructose-specific phosphotransferase system IIA component (Ntr-type)